MIDPEKSDKAAIKELREQVEALTRRVGNLEGAQKVTDSILLRTAINPNQSNNR